MIATGSMVGRSLRAADKLAEEGIDARVLEIHTIKPIDSDLILQAAEETGAIVTAEEHSIIGGLGGAVAEVLARGRPTPTELVGVADVFARTGPDPDTLGPEEQIELERRLGHLEYDDIMLPKHCSSASRIPNLIEYCEYCRENVE